MATNTAGSTARVYHQAQTTHISLPITFSNMLTAGTSPKIGTVPAGAVLKAAGLVLSAVFNSGSANQVGLGVSAGAVTIAALATVNTLGNNAISLAASAAVTMTADTDIYLANGYTGTQATTGAGLVWVEYICPDSILV